MTWELAIHHIDVAQGDSTLIVAKYQDLATPANNVTRTVLIDGGKRRGAAKISARALALGINQIDSVAITHYDDDHYQGITELISTTTLLNTAVIYDQGMPPRTTIQGKSSKSPFSNPKLQRRDSPYQKYLAAIQDKRTANNANTLRRVTATVNSFDTVRFSQAGDAALPGPLQDNGVTYANPDWLIGKDILWGNGDFNNFQANPPQPGAPTVVCIAANKYVTAGGNNRTYPTRLNIYNGPNVLSAQQIADQENSDDNAKSLAFLVTFNNFKYYIGGDIRSEQEDGNNNPNYNNAPPFVNGIRQHANAANNFAGRIHAMKASHHGSNESSSATFLGHMRPAAVFISAGAHRSRTLPPVPALIARLDAANNTDAFIVQRYYLTNKPQLVAVGANAIVAGTVNGLQRLGDGHIRITVTSAGAATASADPDRPNNVSHSTPYTVTYTDNGGNVQNANH